MAPIEKEVRWLQSKVVHCGTEKSLVLVGK
jgi:hypothetical protein